MRIDKLGIRNKDQMVRRCIVRPFFPLVPLAGLDVRFESRPLAAVHCIEPDQGQNCRSDGKIADERVASRDPAGGLRGIMPKSHPQERAWVNMAAITDMAAMVLTLQPGAAGWKGKRRRTINRKRSCSSPSFLHHASGLHHFSRSLAQRPLSPTAERVPSLNLTSSPTPSSSPSRLFSQQAE